MAWKPKEKQLTAEEAVALARKELAPFWIGSPPLLAGIRRDGVATAHPLDRDFDEKAWLVVLLDPTEYAGEAAMAYAREWFRRYNAHGPGVMLIVKPPYRHFRAVEWVKQLVRRNQIEFPVVVDADGALSEAFRAGSLPKVIFTRRRQAIFEQEGKTWLEGAELKIQDFLRKSDPGLPLSPPFRLQRHSSADMGKLELGAGRGTRFAEPGFGAMTGGFAPGNFPLSRPETISSGEVVLGGSWLQDAERIATTDPEAFIAFRSPGARVSIVAQAVTKVVATAKVAVEVDGVPAYESFAGENLVPDEEGLALLRVESEQLYHVLSRLPANKREITLRFVQADRVPVAVYGIRFGA